MATVFGVIAVIVSLVLAWMFSRAGWSQLATPVETLARSGREWVYALPVPLLRLLGATQFLGAVVLAVSPAVTLLDPGNAWSGPVGSLVALGFLLLMVAAAVFHGRRGELQSTWTTHVALGSLALFSAISQWIAFGQAGA